MLSMFFFGLSQVKKIEYFSTLWIVGGLWIFCFIIQPTINLFLNGTEPSILSDLLFIWFALLSFWSAKTIYEDYILYKNKKIEESQKENNIIPKSNLKMSMPK